MPKRSAARVLALLALAALAVPALAPAPALASSHNEAPFTSKNPSIDNTDFYFFRDPNDSSMVNLISCYYGLIEPQGGPNYAGFQDGAWYDIKIDNNGDGVEDVTFRFTFKTQYKAPETFLYALPGVTSITDSKLLVTQTYSLDQIKGGTTTRLLVDQPVVPPNIGTKTIPNYPALPNGIQSAANGKISVFVGPRQDPFFVDLGMTFDAVNLETGAGLGRPGVGVGATGGGRDTLYGYTVLSTAMQVPIAMLTSAGIQVNDAANPVAILGAWSTVSIPASRTINADGSVTTSGSYQQVSRLGNPLVNEVLVGVGRKDRWNAGTPATESAFKGTADGTDPGELYPILATYMNVLFGIQVPPGPRGDIELALFRGLPGSVASLFGVGATQRPGEVYSDQLRLNTAVAPTPFATASRLGYLGGDPAGFPNGRRMCDDVVDIELRVVAGIIVGLLPPSAGGDPTYAQAPNSQLGDGVDFPQRGCRYFFPYMWSPTSGFAALHAGAPAPTHTPQVRALKDAKIKGFPEGISDEDYAERVRISRDRDDLARIQTTKDAR
ncbi:MAG: DUF4331 domain-containing protein [Acidobacteriota bacterium]